LRADLCGIVNQTQKANQSDVGKAASTALNSKVLADNIVDDLRRGQSKAPKTLKYKITSPIRYNDTIINEGRDPGKKVQS